MAAPKPYCSNLSTLDLQATEMGDMENAATAGRHRATVMGDMENVATVGHCQATEMGDMENAATAGRHQATVMGDIENVATVGHQPNVQNISSAMKLVLEALGEDTGRDGLRKTPERFAKAIVSLTSGYNLNPISILKDAIFEEDCHDLVVVKDIPFSSLCEHHLLPFFGKAHIGYMPNGRVVGLSKPARVVNVFAKRLQLQERLTRQVAQCLFDVVQPRGVAVVIESTHMCMAMRGVEKIGSSTTTTCFLGEFKEDENAKEEFWRALQNSNN